MHELPVMESILNIVLRHAGMNRAQKIVSITLVVGELCDLEVDWMQQYFNFLSADTIAAGAELRVNHAPVILRCPQCGSSFTIKKDRFQEAVCPDCAHDQRFDIVSGQEYFIKEMEVL